MPRKLRVSLANVAEHVIQRGNNRQAIFANEDDMKSYLAWLKQYAKKYEVKNNQGVSKLDLERVKYTKIQLVDPLTCKY
ncbi:hypothetical protein [Pseudocolwellia agarivorans]|uniref:hypothetical protein n=1 Tax=Pseudocolwellia agarivorans TaxID=1911682 RepID=UPI000985C001|nr:hypothetical protein [Pseudocolwellia agarivorans]